MDMLHDFLANELDSGISRDELLMRVNDTFDKLEAKRKVRNAAKMAREAHFMGLSDLFDLILGDCCCPEPAAYGPDGRFAIKATPKMIAALWMCYLDSSGLLDDLDDETYNMIVSTLDEKFIQQTTEQIVGFTKLLMAFKDCSTTIPAAKPSAERKPEPRVDFTKDTGMNNKPADLLGFNEDFDAALKKIVDDIRHNLVQRKNVQTTPLSSEIAPNSSTSKEQKSNVENPSAIMKLGDIAFDDIFPWISPYTKPKAKSEDKSTNEIKSKDTGANVGTGSCKCERDPEDVLHDFYRTMLKDSSPKPYVSKKPKQNGYGWE